MQKRKTFSREFKLEAVRLLKKGDKPAAEIARQLGIARNKLYLWRDEVEAHGDQAFPGRGRPTSDKDAEIARLKRELDRVTEERDILKKAALYFAKESR
ncbi:MAG: transposase [Chromatiales bacterium]|nr:transposase [Chromatiales bacterium]